MKVEYRSNNSGGSWWLDDKDWKALAKAGWEVQWGGEYFCRSRFGFGKPPAGKLEPCAEEAACPGHRRFDAPEEIKTKDDRYMGALAKSAVSRDYPDARAAIEDWERITGQTASDEGCNCCGNPHDFTPLKDNGEPDWDAPRPRIVTTSRMEWS